MDRPALSPSNPLAFPTSRQRQRRRRRQRLAAAAVPRPPPSQPAPLQLTFVPLWTPNVANSVAALITVIGQEIDTLRLLAHHDLHFVPPPSLAVPSFPIPQPHLLPRGPVAPPDTHDNSLLPASPLHPARPVTPPFSLAELDLILADLDSPPIEFVAPQRNDVATQTFRPLPSDYPVRGYAHNRGTQVHDDDLAIADLQTDVQNIYDRLTSLDIRLDLLTHSSADRPRGFGRGIRPPPLIP